MTVPTTGTQPHDDSSAWGTVAQRLALHHVDIDEDNNHIVVNQRIVRRTGCASLLVRACPAHVFSQEADGSVTTEYAACLECGTCTAIAPAGAVHWRYPRGGFGVSYREG